MKRFGSILGRSHGSDNDGKKLARQRSGASAEVQRHSQEPPSPSVESDVPLAQAPSGKSVSRASTTGAELSPANRVHTRGVSVDAGSPRQAAQAAVSGPPLGVDRRRQASMSLASRRPKTTGSLAPTSVLQEADEHETAEHNGGHDLFDQSGPSESKPVYLKVCVVVTGRKGHS